MIAEAQPIVVIIGIPDTCSPAIASTTVMPAKRTDSPAVAFAVRSLRELGVPDSRF